jgi:hypothetical protein
LDERFSLESVCLIAAALVSVLASIPASPIYEPTVPYLLPALWPLWTLFLRQFFEEERSSISRAPLFIVHVGLGSSLAFHLWNGCHGRFLAPSGEQKLPALVIFCLAACWLALTQQGKKRWRGAFALQLDAEPKQAMLGALEVGATIAETENDRSLNEHHMERGLFTLPYHDPQTAIAETKNEPERSLNANSMENEFYSSTHHESEAAIAEAGNVHSLKIASLHHESEGPSVDNGSAGSMKEPSTENECYVPLLYRGSEAAMAEGWSALSSNEQHIENEFYNPLYRTALTTRPPCA